MSSDETKKNEPVTSTASQPGDTTNRTDDLEFEIEHLDGLTTEGQFHSNDSWLIAGTAGGGTAGSAGSGSAGGSSGTSSGGGCGSAGCSCSSGK